MTTTLSGQKSPNGPSSMEGNGSVELTPLMASNGNPTSGNNKSGDHIPLSGYNSISSHSPWTHELQEYSLPEYHDAVVVPETGFGRVLAFLGPGAMIAVGYMDPGNWSTDIAGGSSFGYDLLHVILISSVIGMFLQFLALKTGLATNRDIAQICRDSYPPAVVTVLWVVMEVAICATDIAEVLGSAIALKLLFGLPIIYGVCLTACDVLVLLFFNHLRGMEMIVILLILIIFVCFLMQIIISSPVWWDVFIGLLPSTSLVTNESKLYLAISIIGATIMPHNLFLHSSICLTRQIHRTTEGIKQAVWYSTVDSTVSLCLAFFVNASILIVSSATFHKSNPTLSTLEDAYHLMDPLLHSSIASVLFGVALLASGQNSTLTGTLTGQIIMEGFMSWKISPTARRLLTRLIAILPAVCVTYVYGEESVNQLLIFSQVVLAFTLPFAIVPLIHISSSVDYMGAFVNNWVTTVIAVSLTVVILALNVVLVFVS